MTITAVNNNKTQYNNIETSRYWLKRKQENILFEKGYTIPYRYNKNDTKLQRYFKRQATKEDRHFNYFCNRYNLNKNSFQSSVIYAEAIKEFKAGRYTNNRFLPNIDRIPVSTSTLGDLTPNANIKAKVLDLARADYMRYGSIKKSTVDKLAVCGSHITSAIGYDRQDKRHHHIMKGMFCDFKFCPIRQKMNSRKLTAKIYTILRTVYKKYGWIPIFITLTIPNIKPIPSEVKHAIKELNRWKNMAKTPRYNGFNRTVKKNKGILKGWFSKIEFRYNNKPWSSAYQTLNFHIHIIGLVHKSYFNSKYYVPEKQWLKDWRYTTGDNSIQSISVEAPYYKTIDYKNGKKQAHKISIKDAKTPKDMDNIFQHSADEEAKYLSKSTDFGDYSDLDNKLPKNPKGTMKKLNCPTINNEDIYWHEINNITTRPWLYGLKNSEFTHLYKAGKKEFPNMSTDELFTDNYHAKEDYYANMDEDFGNPMYVGYPRLNKYYKRMKNAQKQIEEKAKEEIGNHKKSIISDTREDLIKQKYGTKDLRKLNRIYIEQNLSKRQQTGLKAFNACLIGGKNQKIFNKGGYFKIFSKAYNNGDLSKYEQKPKVLYSFKIQSDYKYQYHDYLDTKKNLTLNDIKKLQDKKLKVNPLAIGMAKANSIFTRQTGVTLRYRPCRLAG